MVIRVFAVVCLALAPAIGICAQTTDLRTRTESLTYRNQGVFPFRRKPTKEQRKQLQPKTEDTARYALLLEQQNAGIFRLLPDAECETNPLVVRVDEICRQAIPESSYFSFRERRHAPQILSDIRLKNNYLISDGILAQGIIVNLGDVALESVTTRSEGLRFLNEYQPAATNREAKSQFAQMSGGVRASGYEYRKIVPAIENRTYAMRAIAYKGSVYRTFRGFRFNLLEGDRRIDLIIAFRIVRKESDGALTFVWKELKRREAPRLKAVKKSDKITREMQRKQ